MVSCSFARMLMCSCTRAANDSDDGHGRGARVRPIAGLGACAVPDYISETEE